MMHELVISRDDHDRRIDRVLRKAFPRVPPGAIAGAIRRGAVRLNGRRCKNSTRTSEGDRLKIPEWDAPPGPERTGTTEDAGSATHGCYFDGTTRTINSPVWEIPLLKRTPELLALNKPAGLAVHGADSLQDVVRAVAARERWWNDSLSFRPGPVHRLDRNTSGVQLFALSTTGARFFSRERWETAYKLYLGVVIGVPRETEVSLPLAYDTARRIAVARTDSTRHRMGELQFRPARTTVVPLRSDRHGRTTLVAAIPATGRTHQIRCHLAALGHPLEHDRKYHGGSGSSYRYVLHNLIILFPDADPGNNLYFNAPIPPATRERLAGRFDRLPELVSDIENLIASRGKTGCTADVGIGKIHV